MSTETMDLPGNANTDTPMSEDIGGTGISNPLGNTITVINGPVSFTVPEGGSAITLPASGTVVATDTGGALDIAIEETSATPGTVRAITGEISDTSATLTAGNLVGVRGSVTVPVGQITSGNTFLYGVQGKAIVQGEITASTWMMGVFGQLDIDTATLNGGQIACVWGDAGTSGPAATVADFNMIRLTNTTPTTANAVLSAYGKASFVLDMQLNGGIQFLNAGTSAGSAGDTAHCNATKVLAIQVDGVPYWIPAFDQNS